MATLPGGSDMDVCDVGASLTSSNIMFATLYSALFGVMVAGLRELHEKRKVSAKTSALSGVGMVVGSLTLFCSVCTIPLLSLFGLSTVLAFFTEYNALAKIFSLVLIGAGLYSMNKQLDGVCRNCK